MFFPDVWGYELFETFANKKENPWSVQGNSYATDYETFKGKKDYAEETAGGYYAARLPIMEYLKKKKRQSSVLVLRFITEEYWAPLGVWVCRESVRKALKSNPIEFDSREYMLKYAYALSKKKFGYDIEIMMKKSKILNIMKTQRKLTQF